MKITTEKATHIDIQRILAFMKNYYHIERIEFHKERSRKAIIDLLQHEDIGSMWMIKCNNKEIGYYCLAYNYSLDCYGRDCFLDEVYIDTAYRHRGVGTEVMKQITNYLKSRKFKGLHLLVRNFNKPAYAFYKKSGFVNQDGKFMTKRI